MLKASKILLIIGLVIGIIWSVVGFFGVWFGGAFVAAVQDTSVGGAKIDPGGAAKTLDATRSVMTSMLGGFCAVLIGGILGIVGCGPVGSKAKTMILGGLTVASGVLLVITHNWIAAALYLLAGFLVTLAGATHKPNQSDADAA